MVLREQDKHFLWSIYIALGFILAWKGVSEGVGSIPFFDDPWVVLFISFTILTFSGLIMREYDPLGSLEKAASKVLHHILRSSNKKEYNIIYQDTHLNEQVSLSAENLIDIEKGTLIFENKALRQEFFIPSSKIDEIKFQGKTFWRQ